MFEKFTERCRKVMSLSRQEAQRLSSEFIGAEHILLGLLQEGGGNAAQVLKNLNVSLMQIRRDIEKLITPSTSPAVALGQLPFSPQGKRIIERAGEASSSLTHDAIGTEHLLLGLLQDDGIAGQVLYGLGLRPAEVREMTLRVLGQASPQSETSAPPNTALPSPHLNERDLYRLAEGRRDLADRPALQEAIARLLQQGRSIALVGPNRVGKTSVVEALSRARAGTFTYWSVDYRMFDPFFSQELGKIRRPGTVCFVSEGELLTASRSLDASILNRRKEGGERLILEFREGGLEAFAARYPSLAKNLETIRVNPPDSEECLQLLESARVRVKARSGFGVTDAVLRETERLAREQWPLLIRPWATLITLWKAESLSREALARGDESRLLTDIENLEKASKHSEADLLRRHVEGLRGARSRDLSMESIRRAIADLSRSSEGP